MSDTKIDHNVSDLIFNIDGIEVVKLLARGGMAAVYLARQETLGRNVALKIMDKNDEQSFAERFLNEGRLVASLSHPSVITIHDLGLLDDGRAYISMEFIDGGDLETRLKQAPVSVNDAVRMLRSLAESLQYVHAHGVIHRDIKPANILFRQNGTLVLTDFGIAKQQDNDIKLTRDGVAVGSPGYMSPEQAQAKAIDHRTDLYSLGVIFSEMLLGKNEFEADSYVETSMNHIQMEIPQLPFEISQYQILLDKLLAKDPEKRFKDAETLMRYIDSIPEYEEGEEEIPELPQMQAPSMRKTATIITVLVFLLLGGGLFYGYKVYFADVFAKHYIAKAEAAVKADKLLVPENDNAVMYYNRALFFNGQSAKANQGLATIADKYAGFANSAYKRRDFNKMRLYIERGLTVDPEHKRLLQLKEKLQ
jgi:tRNA A-37 threonylcarbamoyl transferase component Bud32